MKSAKAPQKTTKKVTPMPAASRARATVPVAPVTPVTNGASVPAKIVASPAKVSAPGRKASTVIEAKIDVGFGNQLFLRGQGSGLSWDRGIPLECVDSRTWRLTFPAEEKLLFKLLLNDSVWAKGEDVVVTPGQRVEITPAF